MTAAESVAASAVHWSIETAIIIGLLAGVWFLWAIWITREPKPSRRQRRRDVATARARGSVVASIQLDTTQFDEAMTALHASMARHPSGKAIQR